MPSPAPSAAAGGRSAGAGNDNVQLKVSFLKVSLVVCWLMLGAFNLTPALAVDFDQDIAPILQTHCLACHDAAAANGDVRLDLREHALQVLTPGQPEESLLLQQVEGDEPAMPLDAPPLSAAEVQRLRDWIAAGAPWPEQRVLQDDPQRDLDWWSLRPLPELAPSSDEPGSDGGHPVDVLLERRLAAAGITPQPPAEPEVLLRRLTYDLTGLPPTPEEVAAFSIARYEQTVDRLLASPAFGEKWARHWLDAARYGETHGYDKDQPRNHAWPYRDYVIAAFNDDKPYLRFVQEQIAGDLLFPDDPAGVVALGFLAAGPWDLIGHVEVGEQKIDGRIAKHLDRDEMISAVFNVFTSTTVQCAQCHHHKFDPVKMEDYYRLHAVFAAVDRADREYAGPTPQQHLQALPRGPVVYAATSRFDPQGQFIATGGKPRTIHLLQRGDIGRPGEVMRPGMPPLWPGAAAEFPLPLDAAGADAALARAALARAVGSRENPLLWRSIVNRLWQWTFSQPLVGTPNDFGRMGMQPTHPELLDALAVRLRDDPRQSLKSIIRLLVTSAAYRRASAHDEVAAAIDADNQLLWRGNRRRLTAEEFRDTLLWAAGKLRLDERGGPSFRDFVIEKPEHSPHYQYHLSDPDDALTHRRSIYRFIVRSQPQPLLTVLDCADPSLSVAARDESTTALQALTQWNNRLVAAMAQHFGERISAAPADPIDFACRIALGRPPDATEQAALSRHLQTHGAASLARVLFNLNAFVYVD